MTLPRHACALGMGADLEVKVLTRGASSMALEGCAAFNRRVRLKGRQARLQSDWPVQFPSSLRGAP